MPAAWTPEERSTVEQALTRYPATSGHCAALARVVHKVGIQRDEKTRGRQVRPKVLGTTPRPRWIIPKHPSVPKWASHTYVETHEHAVDALTGVDGYEPSEYLEQHFSYAGWLEIVDVDVFQVDPGIEDDV